MTYLTRRLVLAAAVVFTIGCDHVTKSLATMALAGSAGHSWLADTIRLQYAENAGGFLSLGAQWPWLIRTGLFTTLTGLVLLLLAALVWRSSDSWSSWPAIGLTLFVAGGLSNWIDRVSHGTVVDFMNLGVGSLRTGIFNVADVAIMIGGAMYGIAMLRESFDLPKLPA